MTDLDLEPAMAPDPPDAPLLEATDLVKEFPIRGGVLGRAVGFVLGGRSGVDPSSTAGETLGLVGESGCGKSTTGRLLLDLIPPTSGTVLFDGIESLTRTKGKALAKMRQRFQIVFQDPYASLNPRMTVGATLAEPLRVHFGWQDERASRSGAELLTIVGLSPEHANRYPARVLRRAAPAGRHRTGTRRSNPTLIVLDEPVSALDVSIQAGVVNLLDACRTSSASRTCSSPTTCRSFATSPTVSRSCTSARSSRTATRDDIYDRPGHPYTQALLSPCPLPDPARERADASGSCSRATCPARSTRRAAAGSAPAAGRIWSSRAPASTPRPASTRSRCSTPPSSATRWPATSPRTRNVV